MKLYLDSEREFIQQLQTVDYMNYFIRQTSDCLEYGNVHPNYIQEEYYAILELHIEDLVFSTYITNYGPGDFCFSMKTGLDLSSFVHLYNEMEDDHLDFLKHQLPTFMNLVLNTATKGSETNFFDEPFFSANDIVNEDTYTWPVKYKILVGKPLGEYLKSHILPMLCYAVKLMDELYNFTNIPSLTKSDLLSSDGCTQEQLVRKAYHLFQKYGYL